MDPRLAAYCQYYQAQRGGELPVFRGGRGQSGEGLGDILRGIFRFLAPIALRGLSVFAGHTLDAHKKGATLGEAAKSALNPTLRTVVGSVAEQFRGQQTGSGNLMALYQAHKHRYAKLAEDEHNNGGGGGGPYRHADTPRAFPYVPAPRDHKGRFKRSQHQSGRGGSGANVYKSTRGRRLPRSSSPLAIGHNF